MPPTAFMDEYTSYLIFLAWLREAAVVGMIVRPQPSNTSLQRGERGQISLIYKPTGQNKDGKYPKITVRLASGNYHLAYRDGYYAEDSIAKPSVNKASSKEVVGQPVEPMRISMQRGAPPATEIVFKVLFVASSTTSNKIAEGNVVSSKSKPPYRLITVAYAANPGDIAMPINNDGLRHIDLDIATLVYDKDGQLFTQQTNRVDVFAKPEAFQDFLCQGVRYQQQISVPTRGEYYLRTDIHDLIGDKIGVIEVPAASISAATSVHPTSSAAN